MAAMSALVLLLALQAALATPGPIPPVPNTPVAPVVIEPRRDSPKLVRTYPAAGAVADFGVLVLTVAFDQPMDPVSAPKSLGPAAPDCRPDWRLLSDRKTFVLLCTLKAGEAAHVTLAGFKSSQEKAAEPVDLAFTGDADKVDPAIEDALSSAGLKPEDGPVMDWRPAPTPSGG